ncbi:DUF3828 domain-containing protein [Methylocystis heyeri]|uniref:DUF3828 domain-containing protein n=1 Tax=Methylocystis heyeri TaxID=391905 RepID=A0A6B8KF67_9HYPH|nr:DUF3828 domain-containing protein [Methylocystis heyeri]QGM46289.1 DUF3828 domain-containing protein [Methylocystis heyeri]
MNKPIIGAFVCALMALLCVSPALAEKSPREMVVEIYRLAAGPKGDYSAASPLQQRGVRAEFTPSLRKAMEAMERRSKKLNEPILDFDPITNSQDPSVIDLKIETEKEEAKDATVAASFKQEQAAKTRTTVRYLFKKEAAAWKLDDIAGDASGEKWDLREIIKGE